MDGQQYYNVPALYFGWQPGLMFCQNHTSKVSSTSGVVGWAWQART